MEALAYQEEYKEYELINGREYMMSRPSYHHMRIEGNIFGLFDRYLDGKKCRAAFEMDVYLSEKDHVIPDVVIVCNPDVPIKKKIKGVPDLIVEVLSPSTSHRDRFEKLRMYEKYGVKEYWIVDPRGKFVEVYLLKNGSFELDNVYYFYSDAEREEMTDKEQEEADSHKEIKVSLYDDFTIDIAEVFRGVD